MRPRAFRPALAFPGLTPPYDRTNDLLGFGAPFVTRILEVLRRGNRIAVGCCPRRGSSTGIESTRVNLQGRLPEMIRDAGIPGR